MSNTLDALMNSKVHVIEKSSEGSRTEDMRTRIRTRLNLEIPSEPYLAPSEVAQLLKIKVKTLANDRSSKTPRWPQPVRLAGGSKILYVRSQVIEWLVEQEVTSATIRVHRCQ